MLLTLLYLTNFYVIPEAMSYLFDYRKSLKGQMKDQNRILQQKIKELHELENSL